MKNYLIFTFSTLVLLFFLSSSKQQDIIKVRDYDIRSAGIKIGTLRASRVIKDNITTYNLKSDVNIRLITHYRIKDEVNSIYKNGILQSATVKTNIGSKTYSSLIAWNKDHYDININAHKYNKKSVETIPIRYSGATVYFEEPPASAKVFSEVYGVFSNNIVLEPHKCKFEFLGKANKFTYKNDELIKAEIQNSVKDFEIVPGHASK